MTDRHGCKLQLDWLVKAYNHEAVILVEASLIYLAHIKDTYSPEINCI